MRASQGATKVLIRKYINKDVLKTLVRLALKYLGLRLTQKAIISKTVPVVGGITSEPYFYQSPMYFPQMSFSTASWQSAA